MAKDTPSTRSKKNQKGVEEDILPAQQSPKPAKQKGQKNEQQTQSGQQTLDKHLDKHSNTEAEEPTDRDILRKMQEAISNLASKEYIEIKLEGMLTENLLCQKLEEIKLVIREEVRKEVMKDVDLIKDEVKVLSENVSGMNTVINELRNKVSDLEEENKRLGGEIRLCRQEKNEIDERLKDRELKLRSLEEKNNDLEQYTRRNSLRIYGLNDSKSEKDAETTDKVLEFCKTKLSKSLSHADIDACHRLGKFSDEGNRPVLVKFVKRTTKMEIIRSRRILKGSAVVIREDLTSYNAKLLSECTEYDDKVETAWSHEGKIIVLLKDNRKITVRRAEELNKLVVEVPPPGSRTLTIGKTRFARSSGTLVTSL